MNPPFPEKRSGGFQDGAGLGFLWIAPIFLPDLHEEKY